MGGAPAEADEGHICRQPHCQAPLRAITHSKAMSFLSWLSQQQPALGRSWMQGSKPLPPASASVITQQSAPGSVSPLKLSGAQSYSEGSHCAPEATSPVGGVLRILNSIYAIQNQKSKRVVMVVLKGITHSS